MEWSFKNSIQNRIKLNAFRTKLLSTFPGWKLGCMKVLENSSLVNEHLLAQVFEQTPIFACSAGGTVLVQQIANESAYFIFPAGAGLANPKCIPHLPLMPLQRILLEFEIQSGTAQDHINFSQINSVGLSQKGDWLVLRVETQFDLLSILDKMVAGIFQEK